MALWLLFVAVVLSLLSGLVTRRWVTVLLPAVLVAALVTIATMAATAVVVGIARLIGGSTTPRAGDGPTGG